MKSLLLVLLVCGFAGLLVPGCSDEVDCFDCACDPAYCPEKFENLSQKWHVLNNLELAINQRRLDRYNELLDENFTFFLASSDVGGGLPAQWDRTVEINANTNLFASDPPDPLPRCKDIDLDIHWEDAEGKPVVTWIEITTPGGETRYTTTVFYDFQVDVEPDLTYINNPGSKAQFTVRNAGTEEVPLWKLVEMHDLGGPELVARRSSSTAQSTWGQVKALYRN